MVDYNIEFAHIYADKKFGKEQERSINLLKKNILKCLKSRHTFSCCILIDEYNPKIKRLKTDDFLLELDKHNVYPHFIGFESKLVAKKYFLLNHIKDKKLRKSFISYIKRKNHVPCSFLVAIWYLYRLGLVDLQKGISKCYKHSNDFHGKKIINILHIKYKGSEEKAIEILKNTIFSGYVKNIKTVFYK